jgi:hypothetical protein
MWPAFIKYFRRKGAEGKIIGVELKTGKTLYKDIQFRLHISAE